MSSRLIVEMNGPGFVANEAAMFKTFGAFPAVVGDDQLSEIPPPNGLMMNQSIVSAGLQPSSTPPTLVEHQNESDPEPPWGMTSA